MNSQPPLFSGLSVDDIDLISSFGEPRSFPCNTTLFNQGDERGSVYFIRSGRVKVFFTDENGRVTILRYQGEGDYFGDLGLIDDEPRSAAVETTAPLRAMVVSRTRFHRCLTQNPWLSAKLIPMLAKRIRELTQELALCRLSKAYPRFRAKLYDLVSDQKDGSRTICDRYTQQELADQIGITREYVSRFINDLRFGTYIKEDPQGRIVILKDLPLDW